MEAIASFGAWLRDAGSVLLVLMLSTWVLCIPFVFFTIDRIIKLIRKIY